MTVVTRRPPPAAPAFVPELSEYTADDMLELLTTPVFDANETVADELLLDPATGEQVLDHDGQPIPAARIIANQGGSRSSKTRSLAQIFVTRCLSRGAEYTASLVRGTLPALKQSALKDVEAVLKETKLPGGGVLADVVEHLKTEKVFVFPSGARLEYFSVDDEQKLRGATRVDLWVTEANELEFDEWKQLLMRTPGQVFIDFNPSDDEHHWLQKHVLTRSDCALIVSTYKDNPYLPQTLVDEIESFKDADENYWRVYGLGLLGVSGTTIYTHYRQTHRMPLEPDDEAFGLDFGYNHPTALVRVGVVENRRYAEQLLYKSQLTTPELIEELRELIPLEKRKKIIYADAARPDLIEEIRLAGFNIVAADKDVKAGIAAVKSAPLYILETSIDLLSELRSYKWKTIKDKIIDEPVKKRDDLADALRYVIYNMLLAPRTAATPVSTYQSFGRDDSATRRALGQRGPGTATPGRKHVAIKRK